MTQVTRSLHLPGWDGLRALAATSVLVLHAAVFRLADAPALQAFVAQLQAGVQVFFVASGFMVARPFVLAIIDGRPLPAFRQYGWRRALRIFPAYWLALFASAFILGTTHLSGVGDWITQLLLLQAYRADTFTLGISIAWTLTVEVAFYLLLPVFMLGVERLARRMSPWRALVGSTGVAFAAGWVWVAWSVLTGHLLETFWFPFFLPLFSAGILLCIGAEWVERNPQTDLGRRIGRLAPLWWAASFGSLVLAAALFGTSVLYRAHYSAETQVLYTACAVFAALPLVFGFRRERLDGRMLTSAAFVYVGVVSYGVYLWHNQITTVLTDNVLAPRDMEGSALMVTLAVFILSVAVASLSWFVVERPLARWSRRVM